MRLLIFFVLSITALVFTAGCGSRYVIGGETFSSCSEALQRQSEKISSILGQIKPTNQPIHGNALVLIPSDIVMQNKYLRVNGDASGVGKKDLDCLLSLSYNDLRFLADATKKRRLFDSISVERHNDNPASYSIGDYDFMVFADIDGWFIRSNSTPRPLPIALDKWDKSKPIGDDRILSFLDSLSQQATALRNK